MKKNMISTLAMIAAFAMTASSVEAQIQSSLTETDLYEGNIVVVDKEEEDKEQDEFLDRGANEEEVVEMPQAEKQNITIDALAPLGSGVLLLSCLGGAYLLGKRRKE